MKAKELTALACDWLQEQYPRSIIVKELSVADWGGASIDVAAITDTHIVGVEVKGEGDSPARLDRQGITYGMVARELWLLPDESIGDKCRNNIPAGWGCLEIWDGKARPRNTATKTGQRVKKIINGMTVHQYERLHDNSRYDPSVAYPQKHLCPHNICGTLWRDELYDIARIMGVRLPVRAPVHVIADHLCTNLPVAILHDEMIAALRARNWRKQVIDTRRTPPNDT